MAQKRAFSLSITDTDAFLDMPVSSQCLYFHLGMHGDDDGFVGNPKRLARSAGCCDDDLKVLATKGFIIPFETGVVVIRHWKTNNTLKNDRYHETIYTNEKARLITDGAGCYQLAALAPPPPARQAIASGPALEPGWNQSGTSLEPVWNRDGTKPEPNRNQSGTSLEPIWNQSGTNLEPERNLTEQNITEPIPPLPPTGGRRRRTAAQREKFVPPSVDEVRAYCAERKNGIDANHFVDFYAMKGWMVGKSKMKDWKAAVRTWEKKREEEGQSRQRVFGQSKGWGDV